MNGARESRDFLTSICAGPLINFSNAQARVFIDSSEV